ncbi:MAG: prepilin-type N-terminal cleavage/methylation domain-containing protein [Planctomycetota bacterium]|nr:prepilin-type N-terminal cleavage/methylation domain-containing protein [Planctomycetota bacterium]
MDHQDRRHGFTLLELVLVAAILVILAGIVLPSISGLREDSSLTATTETFHAIRNAVAGTEGRPGYLADMGRLPSTLRDLFIQPAGATPFDRFTARGWRGPYLMDATGTYRVDVAKGFLPAYGAEGDPALADAWGRPVILQVPTTASDTNQRDQFTRIVSAGPDGVVQTPPASLYPTTDHRGDDVLLFLMRPDIAP